MDIEIRTATADDAAGIFSLIEELAIFEKAAGEVINNPEQVAQDIEQGHFVAFVAESKKQIAGMALIYPIYSTWKGLSYYLEDIIVKEAERRKGIGTMLFEKVMEFAAEKGAGRLGWQVLDWNEPAIAFYKKYNPEFDATWINCKLTGKQLTDLSRK